MVIVVTVRFSDVGSIENSKVRGLDSSSGKKHLHLDLGRLESLRVSAGEGHVQRFENSDGVLAGADFVARAIAHVPKHIALVLRRQSAELLEGRVFADCEVVEVDFAETVCEESGRATRVVFICPSSFAVGLEDADADFGELVVFGISA